MEGQPIVEVHTGGGELPAAVPDGPHVEVMGPAVVVEESKGAPTDEQQHPNPVPGTVPAPLESAKPFDAVEYFKSLSMPPQAQEYFAMLTGKAAQFDKLNSSLVSSKIVDAMLNLM